MGRQKTTGAGNKANGGKRQRLDMVLLRLGYITDEAIQQALMRQKARGGRFGSQLLYFKSITLKQLVHALSVQHGVPGFLPREHGISRVPCEMFMGMHGVSDLVESKDTSPYQCL